MLVYTIVVNCTKIAEFQFKRLVFLMFIPMVTICESYCFTTININKGYYLTQNAKIYYLNFTSFKTVCEYSTSLKNSKRKLNAPGVYGQMEVILDLFTHLFIEQIS